MIKFKIKKFLHWDFLVLIFYPLTAFSLISFTLNLWEICVNKETLKILFDTSLLFSIDMEFLWTTKHCNQMLLHKFLLFCNNLEDFF